MLCSCYCNFVSTAEYSTVRCGILSSRTFVCIELCKQSSKFCASLRSFSVSQKSRLQPWLVRETLLPTPPAILLVSSPRSGSSQGNIFCCRKSVLGIRTSLSWALILAFASHAVRYAWILASTQGAEGRRCRDEGYALRNVPQRSASSQK